MEKHHTSQTLQSMTLGQMKVLPNRRTCSPGLHTPRLAEVVDPTITQTIIQDLDGSSPLTDKDLIVKRMDSVMAARIAHWS